MKTAVSKLVNFEEKEMITCYRCEAEHVFPATDDIHYYCDCERSDRGQ